MTAVDQRPVPTPGGSRDAGGSRGTATDDLRVRPRSFRRDDWIALFGCLASALALSWIICFRLAAIDSMPGFVILAWVDFIALYGFVNREMYGKLVARDRVMGAIVATGALMLVVPLTLIVGYVFVRGMRALSWTFFTEDLATTGPLSAADEGGASHAIVGTLEQVAIAVAISVPLSVLTAIYLNEIGGRFARVVRVVIDAMSGLPSIVAGLFIYTTWILALGNRFSGLAAGLALAMLMVPAVTRTSEEVLRLVPGGLRESALALGAPEWRSTLRIVLPTARAGVITAVILGMARAVGETAPLIMTSFGNSLMNADPFDGPQSSLPLFVWSQVRSPEASQIDRAWAGALVLITLVLVLFTLARIVGGLTWKKGSRT